MKTKELFQKLEEAGFEVFMSGSLITARYDNKTFNIDPKIDPSNVWAKLLKPLAVYLNTPLDERKSQPKYRVRLKGFNADSGKQYLTCENKNGKLFGCHLRRGLYQEFTKEELCDLTKKAKLNNQQWLAMLISDPENREPVEEKWPN